MCLIGIRYSKFGLFLFSINIIVCFGTIKVILMLKKVNISKRVNLVDFNIKKYNQINILFLFLKKKNFFFNNISSMNKIYFFLSKGVLDNKFDSFLNFFYILTFVLKNTKFVFFNIKNVNFLNKILNVLFLKDDYFYFFKKFNFFFTVFNKKKVKSIKKNLKKKLKKQNVYLFF